MPCHKCNGYWVCDPDGNGCGPTTQKAPPWKQRPPFTPDAAGLYDVWCKPGCSVVIQPAGEPAPGGTPPWYLSGSMELEARTYEVECRNKPPGPKCQVKLTPA